MDIIMDNYHGQLSDWWTQTIIRDNIMDNLYGQLSRTIIRLVDTDHKITMDLEWKQPMRTYGDLKGYRWDKNDHYHHDYHYGTRMIIVIITINIMIIIMIIIVVIMIIMIKVGPKI